MREQILKDIIEKSEHLSDVANRLTSFFAGSESDDQTLFDISAAIPGSVT